MKNNKNQKIIFVSVLFFCILAGGWGLWALFHKPIDVNQLGLREKIIARRGYWGKYPESTMLGFRKAGEIGAWLSADVLLTKDLQWVLLHDSNLERLYCVKKSVIDLTYDELKNLAYCGPFKQSNQAFSIPLLSDYLKEFGNETIEIEIKDIVNISSETLEAKLRELADMCEKYLGNIYFTSFNYEYLASLKKINPRVKTGMVIFSENNMREDFGFDQKNIDLFTVREAIVSDSIFVELKNTGKEIWLYDMGQNPSSERIKKLAGYDVDGYVVSFPVEFSRKLLKFKNNLNVH